MGEDQERLFLAVELDDITRHAIAAHLDATLEGERLPGRRVPAENWHITLRYLGSTTTVQRDLVLAYLDHHLAVDPFRIRLVGLGGFPRESKASVLWLGIASGAESLGRVAAICEMAAIEASFEPEGRPFHAHLTLARLRPPVDIRPLVESVPPIRHAMDVTAVTLYRSILGKGAAKYEVVDRVEL